MLIMEFSSQFSYYFVRCRQIYKYIRERDLPENIRTIILNFVENVPYHENKGGLQLIRFDFRTGKTNEIILLFW